MSLDKMIWKKMYYEEVLIFRETCPNENFTDVHRAACRAAIDRRIMSEIWSMLNNMKGSH